MCTSTWRPLAACLGAVLLACGGSGGTPSATITIRNDSGQTIEQVFLSPSSQSSWGPGQLSSPVPPGTTLTIGGVPAGTWDVKVVFEGGFDATLLAFHTSAGATTPIVVDPPTTGSIKLVNRATTAISEVYVTATSSTSWGEKQNSAPIASVLTLTLVKPGTYDVLALYPDAEGNGRGKVIAQVAVSVGKVTEVGLDVPGRATVRLVNNLAVGISQLRIRSAGASSWGNNLLTTPIPARTTRTFFDFLAPGSWDFQAVDSGSRTYAGLAIPVNASFVKIVTVDSSAPDAGTAASAEEPLEAAAPAASSADASQAWRPSADGAGELKSFNEEEQP
jgi:hypothetical protein